MNDEIEKAAKRIAVEAGAQWPQDAGRYRRYAKAALADTRTPDGLQLLSAAARAVEVSKYANATIEEKAHWKEGYIAALSTPAADREGPFDFVARHEPPVKGDDTSAESVL